jgi:chemotaxis protein histidine kinase CheA/CheY-like chemotaxis protein
MSDFPDQFTQSDNLDLIELQLQQELQAMFDVDSQRYLQDYLHLVQHLNAQSWTEDMQEIYRAIHTIKGGSVTVGADACLKVATVLEDLLSDLRHLSPAPPLGDGQLASMLQEAGELLASSLQVQGVGEAIIPFVQPSVQRVKTLHEQIKATYLFDWDEQRLLCQEFAEQGFGLVILNLEMTVDRLAPSGHVSQQDLEVATQTLVQLAEIGQDLEFAEGWIELLSRCDALLQTPAADQWRSQWPGYFVALKESARQGGVLIEPTFLSVSSLSSELKLSNEAEYLAFETSSSTEADSADANLTFLETPSFDEFSLDVSALDDFSLDTLESIPLELESTFADEKADPGALTDLLWFDDLTQENIASFADFNPDSTVKAAAATETELDSSLVFPEDLSNLDVNLLSDDLFSEVMHTLEQSSDLTATINEYTAQIASQLPEQSDIEATSQEIANLLDMPNIESVPSIESDSVDLNSLSELDNTFASEDLSALNALPDLVNVPELDESFNLDEFGDFLDIADLSTLDELAQPLAAESTVDSTEVNDWSGLVAPDPTLQPTKVTAEPKRDRRLEPVSEVQIPVPLERLERTSQTLIETLLNVRTAQGLYQSLQSQLAQLQILAQDSAQYITELRKLQDSYALMDDLKSNQSEGPTLERYRQGYTTINRLLETSLRLSELGAEANKSAQQTANSLKSLDRNVLRLRQNVEQSRLLPFSNLGFRAKAILRDLSTRMGKPAQMFLEGEQTELDAATASKLEPALLHLIRNAYDHGLETVADRLANGKPAQGSITLSLRRSGSRYLLELKDDGRGIDAERIRQVAIAKGLPLTQTDTPSQLLAVLCQPGFSSQETVSDISGRGVGMDVVAHQIETLGGRLHLETRVGQGTTFRMQFPVPQLLVSCVQLQVGDRTFAIPAQDIAATTLWDSLEATAVADNQLPYTWQIKQGDTLVPGLDLLQYWQPQSTNRTISETAIALRVRTTEQNHPLWMLVDDLIGQTELLITPVPSPLEAPLGLLGVSLQNDGSLVPVIDAAMLAEVLSQPQVVQSTQLGVTVPVTFAPEPPQPESQRHSNRTILVVDDAALMRRRIEVSLAAHGYTIVTCVDGLDAWNWLQIHPTPAMVITDVEMPNMDGFTLIDRARQSGLTMPMLVVSSRLAEEWSKEANRLGATDYLTKGFTTQELVNKVKSLL